MNKHTSRSEYRRNTRQNICVDLNTYRRVVDIRDALQNLNKSYRFTDKHISLNDTVKWLVI
ncbi:MAG: hypothetical protein CM15mV50_020 [uncultured marine virus]|nr:MAG: hypothetical protein CM15mV50_020 [uncultured marine virus]